MKWDDVIKKVVKDYGIFVGYDASIGVNLESIIGGVPVYNVEAYYMDEDGFKTKSFDTFIDLRGFVLGNESFLKCSVCKDLICEDYIVNAERNEEYCCINHMEEAMNKIWGKDGWRYKDFCVYDFGVSDDDVEIEGENLTEINGEAIEDSDDLEYQFEVLDYVEGSEEKAWRPYHMYGVEHVLNK